MKPRIRSLNEDLALALKRVVGGELRQSKLGEVWADDRTWRKLADDLIMALAGRVAMVDREAYGRIFADAQQMKLVRSYIEEYKAKLPEDRKKNGERRQNPYARWAAENMPRKEGP